MVSDVRGRGSRGVGEGERQREYVLSSRNLLLSRRLLVRRLLTFLRPNLISSSPSSFAKNHRLTIFSFSSALSLLIFSNSLNNSAVSSSSSLSSALSSPALSFPLSSSSSASSPPTSTSTFRRLALSSSASALSISCTRAASAANPGRPLDLRVAEADSAARSSSLRSRRETSAVVPWPGCARGSGGVSCV